MKENLVSEILCTDVDAVRTVQFLHKVVQDTIDSGLVPEMVQEHYQWYSNVLVQELTGVNILVYRSEVDSNRYAACAFTSNDIDHHVVGYGLTAQATFSTCSVCLKSLMLNLKSLAKELGMSWVKLQHRIGVHTYRAKLYNVR
ncbi:hypothetical protein [Aeromonas phage PS]|uniref:Uncharacterized protein n=1 Tax=Aeromonas phage PS TaxID=2723762 RepID=A0A6H0X6L7_9CAUD|nr:hypothetical protein [Aeromonas phage PS]